MYLLYVSNTQPELICKLRFALGKFNAHHLQRLLEASQQVSTQQLFPPVPRVETPPPTFLETVQSLWTRDSRYSSERWSDLDVLMRSQIIAPLAAQVDAAADPNAKARALAKMMGAEKQLSLLKRLVQSEHSATSGGAQRAVRPWRPEDFEQSKLFQDTMTKLLAIF